MDVLVDMVDPSHGNEVMFPVGSIALCQLDFVLAIEMIDIADLLCSASIWMGTQRQSGWPFRRSRREDDCRGPTITQGIFS